MLSNEPTASVTLEKSVGQELLLTLLAGPLEQPWRYDAVCGRQTNVFFAPSGERPEARQHREEKARGICLECPVLVPCRTHAREHREYGFWGGESEEERAAAGYRVHMPVGRIARYPRGEGEPVTAHPLARSQFRPAMLPTTPCGPMSGQSEIA